MLAKSFRVFFLKKIFWLTHSFFKIIFFESMSESIKAIVASFKPENITYQSSNNISIDCDCNSNSSKPEISYISTYGSFYSVAVDQCFRDAIINYSEKGNTLFIERMTKIHAIHTAEEDNELGIDSKE